MLAKRLRRRQHRSRGAAGSRLPPHRRGRSRRSSPSRRPRSC